MIEFINQGDRYPVRNLKMYSDGTIMFKPGADWVRRVMSCGNMLLKPESMNEFYAALNIYDSLRTLGLRRCTLVLPYIPGGRQDRINMSETGNVEGDMIFTLASVVADIARREFSSVVTIDPHSDETIKQFKSHGVPLYVHPIGRIMLDINKKYDGVIAPDKGAVERANSVARPNLPVFYGTKVRDVSTGRLTDFNIDIEPGHYLVVDDICDGGGTFIGLGEKIREQGATADLYVTHGIFSKGVDELKKYYGEIYATDSREFKASSEVNIIHVVNYMIWAK